MNTKVIADDLKRVLENNLPFRIPDFSQRVRITADIDKYRFGEDESVWSQKMGRSLHNFEVLFDGEFVCFFDLSQTEREVVIKMLSGLRSLFQENKVFLNPKMYEVAKEERQAKDIVEIDSPNSEGEQILNEVVKKQAKKRGKKVVVKPRRSNVIT